MALVLVFVGEYDLYFKEQVQIDLESVATEPKVLLDFTRVDYIDRSILAELLYFQKKRRASKLEPAAVVASRGADLSRVLETVDASSLFPVFESSEATLPEGTRGEVRYASPGDTSKETLLLLELCS